MTCVHKVRWSVKRPENCRFRLSVSHYKDRIVTPDEYSGATTVTPSDAEQVLATKDKLVRDDITVLPAPTESLLTTVNGQFTPSSGKVGFSQVNVDVNPDLRPLSVSENGQYSPDGFDGYSDVTVDVEPNLTSLAVTENGLYLPESGVDGYDRVSVDVPRPSGTKQLSVTQNGTVTEDVSSFANVQINTNVVNQDYEDALVALGVTEDLTDGIEALTTYANGVTGESDTTLSDAVASLADGYGQGGISQGIEVVTDSSGKITDYILHMETVPDFVLDYLGNSRNDRINGVPNVIFAVKPKHIGTYAFYGAHVKMDWSGLSELETVNGQCSLSPSYNQYNDASADVVNLPKFVGYTATDNVMYLFAYGNAFAPKVFNLPVCVTIPYRAWYKCSTVGLDITIGSIGHAVIESKSQPFGSISYGSGTVTIYTKGDVLDTLRSAVQNGAGANISFVYKAAEATTYNGTSYQAGDTITV